MGEAGPPPRGVWGDLPSGRSPRPSKEALRLDGTGDAVPWGQLLQRCPLRGWCEIWLIEHRHHVVVGYGDAVYDTVGVGLRGRFFERKLLLALQGALRKMTQRVISRVRSTVRARRRWDIEVADPARCQEVASRAMQRLATLYEALWRLVRDRGGLLLDGVPTRQEFSHRWRQIMLQAHDCRDSRADALRWSWQWSGYLLTGENPT